ncbi:hypothetical protein ACJMK2_013358 [Sinanodonta woodiana]|uniref:Gasdermin pore forming domain-containing protein n=1 Tax=Sinanodonta woodiana TaxID=1069815 RepID=A0ABD3V0K1_SINWO
MFSEACEQLVHEFGKNTLRCTPSLDEENNVEILSVVIIEKETKLLFWTNCNCKFKPTPVKLEHILEDETPINVPETRRVLSTNYQLSETFSLQAKAGIFFKKDLDAHIRATDEVTLHAKFGKVVKTEVNRSQLMTQLLNRKLNLDHSFIQDVRQNANNYIGVVTGVVYIEKESQINRETSLNANTEASAMLPLTFSTKVNSETNQELSLPNNTAIAYNVNALTVLPDGALKMSMVMQYCGGFTV